MSFLDRIVGPGDREAFAAAMLRALARERPGATPSYDAAEFSIRMGGGEQINLHNFWGEVEGASRLRRAALVRRVARSFAKSLSAKAPERWEQASQILFPRLHARVWYELLALRARAAGQKPLEPAFEPLGEHYAIELVCDFPDTVRSVLADDLARWGVDFRTAMMTATRNLRGRAPAGGMALLRGKSGGKGLVVGTGDTYDATRILVIDSLLKDAGWQIDPVVVAPHRGLLLAADPDDAESLQLLATLAEREIGKPYADACVPIRRELGEWRPWLPPEGHPARPALAALARWSLHRDYAEQREAMEAANAREGVDVFVASVLVPKEGSAADLSCAVWTDGVQTWLPRADRVVLLRPRGEEHDEIARVTWDAFLEIAGDRAKPLATWPPRWEVRDFPDAGTLQRLAGASPA